MKNFILFSYLLYLKSSVFLHIIDVLFCFFLSLSLFRSFVWFIFNPKQTFDLIFSLLVCQSGFFTISGRVLTHQSVFWSSNTACVWSFMCECVVFYFHLVDWMNFVNFFFTFVYSLIFNIREGEKFVDFLAFDVCCRVMCDDGDNGGYGKYTHSAKLIQTTLFVNSSAKFERKSTKNKTEKHRELVACTLKCRLWTSTCFWKEQFSKLMKFFMWYILIASYGPVRFMYENWARERCRNTK